MSSSDLAIRIQGLSKSYLIAHGAMKRPTFRELLSDRLAHPWRKTRKETFWALKDISFEVKKGEVVGIIGRNGAGKSTLLKILSRITEPTAGRIELYGRVGSLLEVGTGFHPELTGRENVYLNGAILGMTRGEIRKQFDAIVDFAEVEKFLDTPVKRYSSGMYVRLAFAVAAHLNPEILIVDEVLSVGDAEFQKKCLGKMGEVAKGGRTVLFVSHNMAAVRTLCQFGILLVRGALAFQGSSGDCVQYYSELSILATTEIKAFITRCDDAVEVDKIEVNGQTSPQVTLTSENNTLRIKVTGRVKKKLRMDIEAWISDPSDMPLAFFSAAHLRGVTLPHAPGAFEVEKIVRLPHNLHRGDYYLTISLTDHNIYGWVDCPRCAHLSVEGYRTATGQTLSYRDGKGFLSLCESDADGTEIR